MAELPGKGQNPYKVLRFESAYSNVGLWVLLHQGPGYIPSKYGLLKKSFGSDERVWG